VVAFTENAEDAETLRDKIFDEVERITSTLQKLCSMNG
jgi:hypothetical protein